MDDLSAALGLIHTSLHRGQDRAQSYDQPNEAALVRNYNRKGHAVSSHAVAQVRLLPNRTTPTARQLSPELAELYHLPERPQTS